jgi:large subunit ribosomal protein L24
VLAGKDKNREGEIEKIMVKKGLVIVPGINVYKKHVKGFQGQKGGIYDIPRPMEVSKIVLVCPKCKKPTRVGIRIVGKEKVRVCRKCGKEIDTK